MEEGGDMGPAAVLHVPHTFDRPVYLFIDRYYLFRCIYVFIFSAVIYL